MDLLDDYDFPARTITEVGVRSFSNHNFGCQLVTVVEDNATKSVPEVSSAHGSI